MANTEREMSGAQASLLSLRIIALLTTLAGALMFLSIRFDQHTLGGVPLWAPFGLIAVSMAAETVMSIITKWWWMAGLAGLTCLGSSYVFYSGLYAAYVAG